MIKKTINFSQFCDSFSDTYKDNFTYDGKRALFDYLEQLSDDIGEDIELDPIALCCEYTEYSDLYEAVYEYSTDFKEGELDEETAREWLQDNKQLIEFDGGVIIQNF